MTVDFISIINITGSGIVDFNFGNVKFFGIQACQCQSSFICDHPPVIVGQNTQVGICITTSSPDVDFNNFDLTVTGDQGLSYAPITVNANGQQLHLQSSFGVSGSTTKINFPLLDGLFQERSQSISISGSGTLTLKDGNKYFINEEETKTFELFVFLKPPETTSCQNILSVLFENFKTRFVS